MCIGEDQENCSDKVFEDIIKNQILKALEDVDVYNRLIISYEPTYCIGNGKIPQNNHIEKAISVIKKLLIIKFQYCMVVQFHKKILKNCLKLRIWMAF